MIIYMALVASLLIAGAIAGVLTVLAVGIHREEKAYSLTVTSPSRLVSASRAANGVDTRNRWAA
jgi:hypothetical protein